MQKVNDLYSKQVINQSTGERVASVRDVVLSADARRIVALVVGEGMWSNDERVVPWELVRSIGDYVIVESATPFAGLDDDAEVAELRKQAHRITDKMVVSDTGERLGSIGDMFFDNNGQIIGYSVKQGMLGSSGDAPFLPAEQVQVIGKDAIIATDSDLGTLADVEQMGDVPQEPIPDGMDERATRDLRERSADEPYRQREPMPDTPRDQYSPVVDVPRMPRERQPDDRRDIG
jgi:sporulation protein YlmC with PRC-barrel domain